MNDPKTTGGQDIAPNNDNSAPSAELGMDFSMALNQLKSGKKLSRDGWNGTGMYVMAQRPDEHSKMEQPYLYINPGKGWQVPWVASQNDIFAEDWVLVE